MREMAHRRRGQAYALEGIIGAVIIVSALVLGLQAVDTAPWSDGEEQQNDGLRTEVADVLDASADTGALGTAVTCLDSGGEPRLDVAAAESPATELGEMLANTIAGDYRYRIVVDYPTDSGIESAPLGPTPPLPDEETVAVSRQVTLTDTTPVYEGANCEPTGGSLADRGGLYVDDQHSGDDLYAVVRVRVIAW